MPARLALGAGQGIERLRERAEGVGNPADKLRSSSRNWPRIWPGTRANRLVVAGPRQPAAVHALAFAINAALGNIGQTVVFTKPPAPTNSLEQVETARGGPDAGNVKTLVLLGGNPVYTMPADLNFGAAVKKAASVALTEEENETWLASEWRLPMAHALESWGDARALDGTASIQQPMIEPLYGGRSVLEVAAMVAGREPATELRSGQRLLDGTVAGRGAREEMEGFIVRRHRGGGQGRGGECACRCKESVGRGGGADRTGAGQASKQRFIRATAPTTGDFANSAWMQEAPNPMTKIVWDNVALISQAPRLASWVCATAIWSRFRRASRRSKCR